MPVLILTFDSLSSGDLRVWHGSKATHVCKRPCKHDLHDTCVTPVLARDSCVATVQSTNFSCVKQRRGAVRSHQLPQCVASVVVEVRVVGLQLDGRAEVLDGGRVGAQAVVEDAPVVQGIAAAGIRPQRRCVVLERLLVLPGLQRNWKSC